MVEQDLPLVHLVAGRYREMQGLRKVVDGLSLLLLWTLMRGGSPDGSPPSFLLASLVWAGSTMWAVSRVNRYYVERFGRSLVDGQVQPETPRTVAHEPYRLVLVSSAMWLGGWFAAVLPILTLRAGFVAYRDRPFRPHWLLLVLVGGAFSVAYLAVSNSVEFLEWQWRFIWTAAPALIVVGLFDHRLLVSAMTLRAAVQRAGHADTV
jgi:hypothetical protein